MSYFVLRQIHAVGKSALASEADAATLAEAAATGNMVMGDYLESSDPDARRGRGDERWTPRLRRAKRFASFTEAMECWRAQSRLVPFRPDGKPNRPMTAYSVTVEEVEP